MEKSEWQKAMKEQEDQIKHWTFADTEGIEIWGQKNAIQKNTLQFSTKIHCFKLFNRCYTLYIKINI